MNPNYFQNPNYPYPNHARPNFSFHHSLTPPPPLQPPQTTAPITHDLPAALSSLNNLISLSEQTLNSLPSIVNLKNNTEAPNFISCPYDLNHQMPPESLFIHSLRCPSPLFEDQISLINSLHYPKTLKLKNPSKFEHLNGGNELCLSLDSFYSEFFNCNFFYKDCPGVVELHTLDNSSKTFTLPAFLTVECADKNEGDFWCFDKSEFTILPSDLWVCRREVQSWVDCPSGYSYGVFCAVLRLNLVTGSDLRNWIIVNSPRYGVVIDCYMRDHIYVLFRICLNAIRREALSFCSEMNVKTSKGFNCPVFYQVCMWIASQLSILYCEINAKCFTIHIFRQCILDVLNKVLVPLEGNVKEMSLELNGNRDDVKLQESIEGSIECKVDTKVDEHVDKEVIFVFQVAASVAALHERALLEAKIKGLRESKLLPRCQRMNDHSLVSQRADEERKKRPNFRAIIDHDGLPRKLLNNQDANKTRTREELLAEERDYKRRRMSYRGKKLKRSTLQVMRDLIGEYMQEIEQAGGIGHFDYADNQEGKSLKPSTSPDFSTGIDKLRRSSSNLIEAVESTGSHYQKQSHHDHDSRTTNSKDALDRDYERWGKDHRRDYERSKYQKQSQFDHNNRTLNSKDGSDQDYDRRGKHRQRSNSRDRHDRDYYSGSSRRHKSNGPSHEQSNRQNGQDDKKSDIFRHHEKISGKSNYHSYKSSYDGNSTSELDEKLDFRNWHLRNSDRTPNAKFQKKQAFEDRYDPAESHDAN